MKNLNVFDIFAGCGGFSTGLGDAGLNIKWANEIWDVAATTFQKNHTETSMVNGDANSLLVNLGAKDANLPRRGDVDVIVGGPPCQGFCGINRYRSIDDPRNSLVETFFGMVEILRPRFLVMENVAGILTLDNGRAIYQLLAALETIGYDTDVHILQAGGYGVAQSRWRVFVFASQHGENRISVPKPLHLFKRNRPLDVGTFKSKIIHPPTNDDDLFSSFLQPITVKVAIDDLPQLENGGTYTGNYTQEANWPWQKLIRSGSLEITDHDTVRLGDAYTKRLEHLPFKRGACWLDLPKDLQPRNLAKLKTPSYNYRFGRLDFDGYFNTITSKPEPYWGRFFHPEQQRVISVRECARAQGFPDKFSFDGTLAARYLQVGNAVPPPLGRAIGWELRRAAGDLTVEMEVEAYRRQMQA